MTIRSRILILLLCLSLVFSSCGNSEGAGKKTSSVVYRNASVDMTGYWAAERDPTADVIHIENADDYTIYSTGGVKGEGGKYIVGENTVLFNYSDGSEYLTLSLSGDNKMKYGDIEYRCMSNPFETTPDDIKGYWYTGSAVEIKLVEITDTTYNISGANGIISEGNSYRIDDMSFVKFLGADGEIEYFVDFDKIKNVMVINGEEYSFSKTRPDIETAPSSSEADSASSENSESTEPDGSEG